MQDIKHYTNQEMDWYLASDDTVGVREDSQNIKFKTISVWVTTELECDPSQGEYSLDIESFTGMLDISSYGGVDDISLIKEAIYEMDFSILPDEGHTKVILEESGEWEDVFWHKYYVVKEAVL